MSVTQDDLERALELVTAPEGSLHLESLDPGDLDVVRQNRRFTSSTHIVGYGIGRRNDHEDDLALKVYVKEKLPVSTLDGREIVPTGLDLPGIASAVPTDVEEIGIPTLQKFTDRTRPLAPGYSVGLVDGETGTIGCMVRKRGTLGPLMILSNSHVLARSGDSAMGAEVVQPGLTDGGKADDAVGSLSTFVPFDVEVGFNNLCDAAIADVNQGIEATIDVPLIGLPAVSTEALTIGMQVQKTGRTTGHTVGTIKDVSYRSFVDYPAPGGGTRAVGFRSQVLCDRYTEAGDSGSLVCDMQGRAVGLHWCGSSKVSVFSPLSFVLDALDVELVGIAD